MILKKKVFGSAMLAAAIMSAGTCTAMAAPQQENTAIEAESENSAQTAAGLALKITEGFQNADEQASIEKKEVEVVKASEEEPQDEWQNRLMANVEESLNVRTEASEESALAGKLRKGDVDLVQLLVREHDAEKALVRRPSFLRRLERVGGGFKIVARGGVARCRDGIVHGLRLGPDGHGRENAEAERHAQQQTGKERVLHVASSRIER